jgi:hypothetical protein
MASKVDNLLANFEKTINEPWTGALSGHERVWFLVYDPAEQRKVDLHIEDFATLTLKAGKKWKPVSMKQCFPEWMAQHPYKEGYFEDPTALVDQLETVFKRKAIQYLIDELHDTDDHTLVGLCHVSALYGFVRLNEVLRGAADAIKGRLLVFFPGEYQHNQYRLLDARDGWTYLARPITA